MPRTTAKTENKRKGYNSQDSFRWTTPRVDVAARPVDAFERQTKQKIQAPSNAGNLTPQRAMGTSATIKATNRTQASRPTQYSGAVIGGDYVALQAFLSVAGTVINEGMKVNQAMGEQKAQESTAEVNKKVAGGMSFKNAVAECTPDGYFGVAADHYEKLNGAAARPLLKNATDLYSADPMNLQKTPEDFRAGLVETVSNYTVGTSSGFRQGLGMVGTVAVENGMMIHGQYTQEMHKRETLSAYTQMIPERIEHAMSQHLGSDSDKAIREIVTEFQERNGMWNITKEETTAATLDAIENHILNNPEAITDPSEYLGWTNVKDASGLSLSKSNPAVGDRVRRIQTKHANALERITVQNEKERNIRITESYRGFKEEIAMAVQNKESVDKTSLFERIDGVTRLIGTHNADLLKADYRNHLGIGAVQSNPEVFSGIKTMIAQNRFEELPSLFELEKMKIAGTLSENDFLWATSQIADVDHKSYKDSLKTLKASFPDELLDSFEKKMNTGYVNPRLEKANSYYNEIVDEEKKLNNGLMPSTKRLHEMVIETNEFMAKIPEVLGEGTLTNVIRSGLPDDEVLKILKGKGLPMVVIEEILTDEKIRLEKIDKQQRQAQPTEPKTPTVQAETTPMAKPETTYDDPTTTKVEVPGEEFRNQVTEMASGLWEQFQREITLPGDTPIQPFLDWLADHQITTNSSDFHYQGE